MVHIDSSQEITLREVWKSNMEEEFDRLADLIEEYPVVAMDTEFPGILSTPAGQFWGPEGFNYQIFITNVNSLKLIQVGLVLMNKNGQLPPGNDVWQFNLHFNIQEDMYSHDSLDVLKQAGFDFNKHQTEGILMEDFGELLTTTGLVVNENLTWITFHSCFDFGYLIKCLMFGRLPEDERDFFRLHKAFFPVSFDIKILLRQPGPQTVMLKGGLQEIADQLQVPRIGQRHQAGSDSLLTAKTFFKLKERFFSENWDKVAESMQGQMFGINTNSTGQSTNTAASPPTVCPTNPTPISMPFSAMSTPAK